MLASLPVQNRDDGLASNRLSSSEAEAEAGRSSTHSLLDYSGSNPAACWPETWQQLTGSVQERVICLELKRARAAAISEQIGAFSPTSRAPLVGAGAGGSVTGACAGGAWPPALSKAMGSAALQLNRPSAIAPSLASAPDA